MADQDWSKKSKGDLEQHLRNAIRIAEGKVTTTGVIRETARRQIAEIEQELGSRQLRRRDAERGEPLRWGTLTANTQRLLYGAIEVAELKIVANLSSRNRHQVDAYVLGKYWQGFEHRDKARSSVMDEVERRLAQAGGIDQLLKSNQ